MSRSDNDPRAVINEDPKAQKWLSELTRATVNVEPIGSLDYVERVVSALNDQRQNQNSPFRYDVVDVETLLTTETADIAGWVLSELATSVKAGTNIWEALFVTYGGTPLVSLIRNRLDRDGECFLLDITRGDPPQTILSSTENWPELVD